MLEAHIAAECCQILHYCLPNSAREVIIQLAAEIELAREHSWVGMAAPKGASCHQTVHSSQPKAFGGKRCDVWHAARRTSGVSRQPMRARWHNHKSYNRG